jgi:hypothetical protein
MNIVKLTVKAYVSEDIDLQEAVSEYLLDQDWVSYCDVETVSVKQTEKTFPEDPKDKEAPNEKANAN